MRSGTQPSKDEIKEALNSIKSAQQMSNILANTKIESQNNTYRFLENVRLGGDTNSSVQNTNREIYESYDLK